MNILIDARLYGLENTGIGRYLINLIKGLETGHFNANFTILLRNKYFSQLNFNKRWRKINVDVPHYSFREQLLLPKIIDDLNPDLVHFPHFNIPVFWSGKFVVTIHDMTMHRSDFSASTLPAPIYLIKRLPYKYVFDRAVSRAEKIITPTVSVKNELTDYFKINESKVACIYEGFEADFGSEFNPSVLSKHGLKDDYFIYVGNVYPHKNVEKLIQAAVLLNKTSDKKINLAIVCARSVFTKRLEKFIQKNDANEFIKLIGFVEDDELSSLYHYSKGFINPSLAEGFGLQGLEATSSETVVLASNIPVFKEVYGDFAFFFDPKDTESITSAMKYVLNLEEDKKSFLIDNAKKFITRYSWSKMAEETFNVYEEVLKKRVR